MHGRNSWLQPEQEGPASNLWLSIWHNSSLTKNDPMSHCNFLSLRAEVRHGSSVCDGEGNTDSDANGSNPYPAKRRRGELLVTPRYAERMTPWRKSTPYTDGVVGLHEEILDFYQFMSPLTEEREIRKDLVRRVSDVIAKEWPNAKVELFGSFRTGLFLPTSDIDMVVFGDWASLPLHTLGELLVSEGVSQPEDIKVIESARVPIVKLCDKRSDIKVDISFNMTTGVASAQMIKSYIQQYPVMPKLVMVLKQFLLQRDLNEVFTGGISSYSLILLIVSFLQLHCREKADGANANVGVLLIEFFELYGRNFGYESTAIRIASGGSYFDKSKLAGDHPLANPSFLTIEDPLDETNDISRASWGAMKVKTAFEHAHSVLVSAVLNRDPPSIVGPSILGRIVRISEELVGFRRTAVQRWKNGPANSSCQSATSMSSSLRQSPRKQGVASVRGSSSPVPAMSEAQPTGNQLTYAAAASVGRVDTVAALPGSGSERIKLTRSESANTATDSGKRRGTDVDQGIVSSNDCIDTVKSVGVSSSGGSSNLHGSVSSSVDSGAATASSSTDEGKPSVHPATTSVCSNCTVVKSDTRHVAEPTPDVAASPGQCSNAPDDLKVAIATTATAAMQEDPSQHQQQVEFVQRDRSGSGLGSKTEGRPDAAGCRSATVRQAKT